MVVILLWREFDPSETQLGCGRLPEGGGGAVLSYHLYTSITSVQDAVSHVRCTMEACDAAKPRDTSLHDDMRIDGKVKHRRAFSFTTTYCSSGRSASLSCSKLEMWSYLEVEPGNSFIPAKCLMKSASLLELPWELNSPLLTITHSFSKRTGSLV